MEERNRFYVLLTIVIAVTVLGLFTSKTSILNYFAPLTADANFTIDIGAKPKLTETYLFHVKEGNRYTMLYRDWKVPLIVDGKVNFPNIRIVKASNSNGKLYVKDYRDKVHSSDELSRAERAKIENEALTNEVGMLRISRFTKGTYRLSASYLLYAPILEGKNCLNLNLKLADSHIPYESVRIFIKDPNKLVEKVFPHFTYNSIEHVGNGYLIDGYSPENGLLEVDILMRKFLVNGFTKKIPNLRNRVLNVNSSIYSMHLLWRLSIYLLSMFLALTPVILYAIYRKFGTEKDFIIPKFLSFVPNKRREPYIVNQIFNGDAKRGTADGFYATVLDLVRKGHLRLKRDEVCRVKVILEKEEGLRDDYEKMVYDFFKKNAENNEFCTLKFQVELKKKVESLVNERNREALNSLKQYFNRLFNHSEERLIDKFIDNRGYLYIKTIFKTLLIVSFAYSVFALALMQQHTGISAVFDVYPIWKLLSFIVIAWGIAYLSPIQLFSRWKNNLYREKLQWDAFKNFLSNLVQIRKYAPGDINMWKQWLVYGTALGVAKNVLKAMKELNVNLPEIDSPEAVVVLQRSMVGYYDVVSSASIVDNDNGSGGGTINIGGGFGGGGAGGR